MNEVARIGRVAGRDVPVAALEERLGELRGGPFADQLPPPDSPAGRRLRRWVAQLMLTEELVRAEARRLGVAVEQDAPDARPTAPSDEHGAGLPPNPSGSLTAAVLGAMRLAQDLYRHVTRGVDADIDTARRYYERNTERWGHPERRRLAHLLAPEPPDIGDLDRSATRWTCARDELPEPLARLVFAARRGEVVGPVRTVFGWHLCRVEAVIPARTDDFDTVREEILSALTRVDREGYFEWWVEQRRRDLVIVEPGYEHPGDPRHPDFTHHH